MGTLKTKSKEPYQYPPMEEPSLPDSYEPIPDNTPEPEDTPDPNQNIFFGMMLSLESFKKISQT